MDTIDQARVYRFHDVVAIHLGDGSTQYLSRDQARALAGAVNVVCNDIDDGPFTKSNLETWDLEYDCD